MARRNQSGLDEVFKLLKAAPVWLGPVLAAGAYVLLRWVAPLLFPTHQNGLKVSTFWPPLLRAAAAILAGAILLAWVLAEVWKWQNRRMLDAQTGIESIRGLAWQDFERLVCEAYRRQGYMAEAVGNASGDGGVDIELRGKGELVLVQCKQWKAYSVGVTTIRELLGVVVSRRANRGIVVTSGRFTREAVEFAAQNTQMEQVDGPKLAELIWSVQQSAPSPVPVPSPTPRRVIAPATPTCPLCGIAMVLRTARRGGNAGSQFWGCPKYPMCKGTRETGL